MNQLAVPPPATHALAPRKHLGRAGEWAGREVGEVRGGGERGAEHRLQAGRVWGGSG